MYKKILNERYILGSQPLNKLSSIKQTTRLYTNYLNNTVIYTVSYAYIIVVNEQRSSAINERFIFGKKTRMSFERITKTAISDTFIFGFCDFLGMMSENTDQKIKYIGKGNTIGEYLYQCISDTDMTKVYTIVVKIVDDDHINTDTRIDIECECLGYKHRERCKHVNRIADIIDNNSCCIMCLTPFLDIKLVNSIAGVSAYDQDGKKILINKAGNLSCHEQCIIYLGDESMLMLLDTFYNKDGNPKDLYEGMEKREGIKK